MSTWRKSEIDALYEKLGEAQKAVSDAAYTIEPVLKRAKQMAAFIVEHTYQEKLKHYKPSGYSDYMELLEDYDGKQFVYGLKTYAGEGNYRFLETRFDHIWQFIVPVEWLTMEDREWQAIVLNAEAARLRLIEDAAADKTAAEQLERERHERAEFERLLEKFGER